MNVRKISLKLVIFSNFCILLSTKPDNQRRKQKMRVITTKDDISASRLKRFMLIHYYDFSVYQTVTSVWSSHSQHTKIVSLLEYQLQILDFFQIHRKCQNIDFVVDCSKVVYPPDEQWSALKRANTRAKKKGIERI